VLVLVLVLVAALLRCCSGGLFSRELPCEFFILGLVFGQLSSSIILVCTRGPCGVCSSTRKQQQQ